MVKISFLRSRIISFISACLFIISGHAVDAPSPAATPAATPATNTTEISSTPKPSIPHFGVEMSLSRTAVNVGETIVVTVTYRWPAGTKLVTPDGEPNPARDFANEFVTDLPPPQTFSSGQEERRVFTITLAAQRNGAWELPRPTLTVRQQNNTTSTVASPVYVQVGTDSAPASLPPPRPIWTRTEAPEEQSALRWWWVVLIALILAAIADYLVKKQRKNITHKTPWDVFYDDWQHAQAAGDGKEAGARLSLGLRRCLGTVFRFDGPASTAKEAVNFLRARLQDQEHRDLSRLLEQLDGLRWAADDLPAAAVQPLLENGRTWTTNLKHRLDAEAEAAKQAKQNKTNNSTPEPTTSTST